MRDYKEILRQLNRGFELPPEASLANAPADVQILHVTKDTVALDRLPKLENLRFLCAHNFKDAQFQQICEASQVTHFSANVFGVKELHPIGGLVNLVALDLSDNTKATSLEWLSRLTKLQILVLDNCPISVDLTPISACTNLRYIWLSSRYKKPMCVPSLIPLSGLTRLEKINLTNVRVEDRKLRALHSLNELAEIELPDFFPHEEFIALANALPNARGRWLDAHKLKGKFTP